MIIILKQQIDTMTTITTFCKEQEFTRIVSLTLSFPFYYVDAIRYIYEFIIIIIIVPLFSTMILYSECKLHIIMKQY